MSAFTTLAFVSHGDRAIRSADRPSKHPYTYSACRLPFVRYCQTLKEGAEIGSLGV